MHLTSSSLARLHASMAVAMNTTTAPPITTTIKPPQKPEHTPMDFQILIFIGIIYATIIIIAAIIYLHNYFRKRCEARKRWIELQEDNISLRSLRTNETATAAL